MHFFFGSRDREKRDRWASCNRSYCAFVVAFVDGGRKEEDRQNRMTRVSQTIDQVDVSFGGRRRNFRKLGGRGWGFILARASYIGRKACICACRLHRYHQLDRIQNH